MGAERPAAEADPGWPGDRQQDAPAREVPRGDRCGAPGGQVGLARELRIESLKPRRRLQQQHGSIAAKTPGEGEMAADQVYPGALALVDRSDFRRGDQPESGLERAGVEARLRRRQRALHLLRWIQCQRGRALKEGRGSRRPTTGLRTTGRALELQRDLLVRPCRSRSQMPGTAVRVGPGSVAWANA